ncbi:lysophospholipid acyltransferase family protein [Silvibacterium sp.]|uniref:lysophospholipid acyltransferase family protein n=1 Tax=Silvibacterium sp. TaxID=1964179 RepID=UPI0039E24B3C
MPRSLQPRPSPVPFGTWLFSYAFRAPAFFLSTGFFGSLSLLSSLWDKSGRQQHAIAQSWGRVITRISGAKVRILNPENLDGRIAVYCANHLSYMDTPVIFGSLPFQFRIVARHELFGLPFIGWHLTRSGQVPVNISNPRASIGSLSSAVRTLKSGLPLFIFPEGGRSESGHTDEFLNGPAFMALKAKAPLIPMALIGTWELLPMHNKVFFPVEVILAVGEPIETTGYSVRELDKLTAHLRAEISRLYYQHSWLEAPALPAEAQFETITLEGTEQ